MSLLVEWQWLLVRSYSIVLDLKREKNHALRVFNEKGTSLSEKEKYESSENFSETIILIFRERMLNKNFFFGKKKSEIGKEFETVFTFSFLGLYS